MNRFMLRLYCLLMMCILPGIDSNARQQSTYPEETSIEGYIAAGEDAVHDTLAILHWSLAYALPPSTSSDRVRSSHPTVPQVSHGGNSGRSPGRWFTGEQYDLLVHKCLVASTEDIPIRSGKGSPRFYYVIALRRMLC